ncbi:MAG TPA: NADH-quinone oxidoreductase subunit J [Acidimicrobiales bacterium]
MEAAVFFVGAALVLTGALGVVIARNAVHSALLLVQTLFGVAVLLVNLDAHFLAAVQVIVYAGAIVILFLFVLMLLGVDRAEDLNVEPIAGQRPLAAVAWAGTVGMLLTVVLVTVDGLTGRPSSTGELAPDRPDVNRLGEFLFTEYAFAFEITALLLTIAVVGAVVLSRRPKVGLEPIPEPEPLEQREEVSA